MTTWRKHAAAILIGSVCLFGATAQPAAASSKKVGGAKPGDHPKLDRKLNDRAKAGGSGRSRAIVVLKPGYDLTADLAKVGGKAGRKFNILNGQLIEVTHGQLKKLADSNAILSIHWDRPTGGEMNRAAVVEGARAAQAAYGVNGAGIGVAVIDSGITPWHDDLTYQGGSSLVRSSGGQRVVKFVDFVNGRLTPYDDNGHGTHVAGIIAGNGYDTLGARAGMAPAAHLVSLKVLDQNGGGYISNVIAALDWVVANHSAYNIRVVNLSVGAAVTESYTTDPLTLAAKRVVDAGVVVISAAGNLGKNAAGKAQYGAITAPGNAPWVLTVGAYSHEGSLNRNDDRIAMYSSRGPTAHDFLAKPDLVATGTGIVSLSSPGSTMYASKSQYLLKGSLPTATKPYLSLTGTSMAAPVVAGAVALMLQVNPKLTPNLVKGILQYTAQTYNYDALTQGAGFLNAKGAVDLAKFLYAPRAGQRYPSNHAWSRQVIWGNHRLQRGVLKPAGSAWSTKTVWGAARDAEGDNIVWGTACGNNECENIVWGTALMDAADLALGSFDKEGDNIVWGTMADESENIVWGTAAGELDNIVWGTECGGANCENLVWGTSVDEGELDNIVWGTQMEADNIVWGTSGEIENIVWGTSSEEDNVTWGCSGEEAPLFDDPDVPSVLDDMILDPAFEATDPDAPVPANGTTTIAPPPAILPETTITSVSMLPVTTLGGEL